MKLELDYICEGIHVSKGCANRHEPSRKYNVTLKPIKDGNVMIINMSEELAKDIDIDDKFKVIIEG